MQSGECGHKWVPNGTQEEKVSQGNKPVSHEKNWSITHLSTYHSTFYNICVFTNLLYDEMGSKKMTSFNNFIICSEPKKWGLCWIKYTDQHTKFGLLPLSFPPLSFCFINLDELAKLAANWYLTQPNTPVRPLCFKRLVKFMHGICGPAADRSATKPEKAFGFPTCFLFATDTFRPKIWHILGDNY